MNNPQITIKPRRTTIVVDQHETTIVQVNSQGPLGPPGVGGGALATIATSASLVLQTGYRYICTGLSLQILTLPLLADTGAIIAIHGDSVGLFRVAQLTGQQIRVGNKLTTIGLPGRLDSLEIGDAVDLICRGSGQWTCKLSGNFEVG